MKLLANFYSASLEKYATAVAATAATVITIKKRWDTLSELNTKCQRKYRRDTYKYTHQFIHRRTYERSQYASYCTTQL